MRYLKDNFISKECTLHEALNILNHISDNYPTIPLTLLVIDENGKLLGTITDGDIRRTLVAGTALSDPISSFVKKNFTFLKKNGLEYHSVKKYQEEGISLLPMLKSDGTVEKVYNLRELNSILPFEAVIMAGGEGTRLRPLTYDTPKPLLRVGNKPIIERNMDRLIRYGIEQMTISIRYLGNQIVDYFGDGSEKGVDIRYIREDEPLGTAGALSLIDAFRSDAILLTNSDVLTTLDYEEFYLNFMERDADISIVSIPYRVKVPYGVFDVKDDKVMGLQEKPEYTYYSNAGIYLIKTELLKEIPANKHLDITDFIEKQIAKDKNVVSFPFWGYWLDIGKHEDFENAQKAIQILDSY